MKPLTDLRASPLHSAFSLSPSLAPAPSRLGRGGGGEGGGGERESFPLGPTESDRQHTTHTHTKKKNAARKFTTGQFRSFTTGCLLDVTDSQSAHFTGSWKKKTTKKQSCSLIHANREKKGGYYKTVWEEKGDPLCFFDLLLRSFVHV